MGKIRGIHGFQSIAITCSANFRANKKEKKMGKIGGSHDGLNSYNMLQPILGLKKRQKNWAKLRVVMVFKYGKRFRYAPSFNYRNEIFRRWYYSQ